MDGISSRKRPFDAINSDGDGGCTNKNVGTESSPKILYTPLSCKIISAVAAEREKDMDGNMNASDDQSDGDDGDISEILDLQKALEYLVSTRDIEKIYNTDKQYAIDANNKDNEEVIAQEKNETGQLYMIPNLVNRIIKERYSPAKNPNQHDAADDTNDTQDMHKNRQTEMSRKQKDKLTKLLIAVILEFAEPYFVRMSRYTQQKRAKKLEQLKQKEIAKQTTSPQDSSSFHELDKRATHWATSCINQLLQSPSPTSSLSSSIMSNNSNGNNKQITTLVVDDTYNIPELDALLSGGHDGLDMETCMQSALMQGLQARRLLQNDNENK